MPTCSYEEVDEDDDNFLPLLSTRRYDDSDDESDNESDDEEDDKEDEEDILPVEPQEVSVLTSDEATIPSLSTQQADAVDGFILRDTRFDC